MALTYTPKISTPAKMPKFSLPTVDGKTFSSEALHGKKAKLIAFICGHCPYVQAIEDRLIQLGRDLAANDIPVVAICSNDPTDYPEDSPEALLSRWREKNYPFPYLIDRTQDVARAFGAVCTPDFFVYSESDVLEYRGRLDDSWKDPKRVSHEDLKTATLAIARGEKVPNQVPSMGCSIKWL